MEKQKEKLKDLVDQLSAKDKQTDFFAALGRAISKWANVESSLFGLYNTVLQAKNWDVSSAAYHSVTNLKTKLDMVDAAIRTAYPIRNKPKENTNKSNEQLLKKWNTLKRRIHDYSQRRNDIVHFIVQI